MLLSALVLLSVDERIGYYHHRTAEEVARQVGLTIDEAPGAPAEAILAVLPELMIRHHLDGVQVRLPEGIVGRGVVESEDRFGDQPVSITERHGHTIRILPQPTTRGPLDDRKILLLTLGVLTLLTALALRFVMHRMLAVPFFSMVETAKRFVAGDGDARFDEEREDELGYLSSFINRALDRLQARQARLSYQATHDGLTGLVNRSELERRVEAALTDPSDEVVHALVFADLDRFKLVNDTAGHQAGDALLRKVAEIFRSRIRSSDVLARLGGDEFAVFLRSCPIERATMVAEELRQGIDELEFGWEGDTFRIGVSMGVTDARPGDSMEAVFATADEACYEAKDAGRNAVKVRLAGETRVRNSLPAIAPPAS